MRTVRLLTAIFLAAAIQCAAGCAAWQARQWDTKQWDMSQLRDSRATDLDTRLTQRRATVASPFGSPDENSDENN